MVREELAISAVRWMSEQLGEGGRDRQDWWG